MALIVAGCCRTSGSAHKCDFTPIEEVSDAGTDGPMPCGTAICESGEVCCYTKAPANASCIPPSKFEELRCEKLELACRGPSECPGGAAVGCCVKLDGDIATPMCQPVLACVAAGGLLACDSDADCTTLRPSCQTVGETPDGKPFNLCF